MSETFYASFTFIGGRLNKVSYTSCYVPQATEDDMRRGDVIWTASEWLRAWRIALMRINGAPTAVAQSFAFRHGIDTLDRAFAEGDAFEFQLGLITIFDCCKQAVNEGRCIQWWGN
jgi:hypothetical protein